MADTQEFCTECGTTLRGARFCPNCGSKTLNDIPVPAGVAAEAATLVRTPDPTSNGSGRFSSGAHTAPPTASQMPPRTDPGAPPPGPPPGAQWDPPPAGTATTPGGDRGIARSGPRISTPVLVGALAAALVAAAVAAVVLLSGSGANTTYRQKLASAFSPLVSANQRLSDLLTSGVGSSPSAAQLATKQAQAATTQADGAVSVLTPPSGSSALGSQSQQALTAESNYLQAVLATLSDPSDPSAGQIQTLGSSLQNALAPLEAVVPGASSSVSGAAALDQWANQQQHSAAAAAQQRQQAAIRQAALAGNGGSGSSGGGSGTDCGDGVNAGPNTSCPFAFNVRQAYQAAPGAVATVQVYSPVTGQTYTMNCAPSGSGVTCSGGNNASVSF